MSELYRKLLLNGLLLLSIEKRIQQSMTTSPTTENFYTWVLELQELLLIKDWVLEKQLKYQKANRRWQDKNILQRFSGVVGSRPTVPSPLRSSYRFATKQK